MNLPNKITLTRILMIPLFVLFFYLDVFPDRQWNFIIAGIIFVVAASTDFLDGHIARSRGLVTNLGKFLDPIADKVLNSTAFILLLTRPAAFEVGPFRTAGPIIAGVCVSIIIARELIVSGFRMIAAGQHLVLAADMVGKVKTVVQDVAIAILIIVTACLDVPTAGVTFAYIGIALFWLCTILTVVSGVNYIVKNRQVLSDKEKEEQ